MKDCVYKAATDVAVAQLAQVWQYGTSAYGEFLTKQICEPNLQCHANVIIKAFEQHESKTEVRPTSLLRTSLWLGSLLGRM